MEYCKVIEQVLDYIENHLTNTLTVESVATQFNISKFYFHRLFSASIGSSLSNYILSRKLNTSLTLIQDNQLSLTDIAYLLNFSTQASYTRAFKRQYSYAPSDYRQGKIQLDQKAVPEVIQRSFKNFNGDFVSEFTLVEFEGIQLNGIAFEVDLATNAYKEEIRSHAALLQDGLSSKVDNPCYVVYSNCQPNSTKFKVLFGMPTSETIDIPNFFTIEIPKLFCARFKYSGDLLEIGNVFATDFARFLRISKLTTEDTHIELFQAFDSAKDLESSYYIYVPIKKLAIDSDD